MFSGVYTLIISNEIWKTLYWLIRDNSNNIDNHAEENIVHVYQVSITPLRGLYCRPSLYTKFSNKMIVSAYTFE